MAAPLSSLLRISSGGTGSSIFSISSDGKAVTVAASAASASTSSSSSTSTPFRTPVRQVKLVALAVIDVRADDGTGLPAIASIQFHRV